MPAPKELIFKKDLEQALIQAYVQQPGVTFTPSLTPQLEKFCELVHKTIVKYNTTPAYLFEGPIVPQSSTIAGPANFTLFHNLGYLPNVNPPEKYDFASTQYLVPGPTVLQVVRITNTLITVYGTIGDSIRIVLW